MRTYVEKPTPEQIADALFCEGRWRPLPSTKASLRLLGIDNLREMKISEESILNHLMTVKLQGENIIRLKYTHDGKQFFNKEKSIVVEGVAITFNPNVPSFFQTYSYPKKSGAEIQEFLDSSAFRKKLKSLYLGILKRHHPVQTQNVNMELTPSSMQ